MTLGLLFVAFLFSSDVQGKDIRETHAGRIYNPEPMADETSAEGGDFFQGDMRLAAGQKGRNAIRNPGNLWPGGRVPIVYDPSVREEVYNTFQHAIQDFRAMTCIRWVNKKERDRYYVLITSQDGGCFANIGRTGGDQVINLNADGCLMKGTAIHEMLHALGFGHEQSRNDRGNYVTINDENVIDDMAVNFQTLAEKNFGEEDTQGFPYDYDSVMHYGPDFFSKNGDMTITTHDPAKQDRIGQREGISQQDIAEVNKLYKCDRRRGWRGNRGH